MLKKLFITLVSCISAFMLTQVAFAMEQGLYVDISQPSPIADRTIPLNATTNPVAFTVSDSDGGPLIVVCSSNNPSLVPNTDTHIIIQGKGKRIKVNAEKNEKKHLFARIIPLANQTGNATLTFKVIDTGGLFATKSMDLTVTALDIAQESTQYAFLPTRMDRVLKQWVFSSEPQPLVSVSIVGQGKIRMDNFLFAKVSQQIMIPEEKSIEALPDDNWQFAYWSGDIIDTQNPLRLDGENNLNIQAVFISSDEDQQTQLSQNWHMHLWLSSEESPEEPVTEINLGVSDETDEKPSDSSMLYIVSESDNPLAYEMISNTSEQFRPIQVFSDSNNVLRWDFIKDCPGTFELLDATTHSVLIPDMKSVTQWSIPDKQSIQPVIHYMPE